MGSADVYPLGWASLPTKKTKVVKSLQFVKVSTIL